MLDLLIGIFMTVGVQYTQLDDGRIAISANDAERLQSSSFQQIFDEGRACESVVITESVDPTRAADNKE